MMLGRLFYGMARHQELPAWLAWVHPRTRTPVRATAVAGGIILAAALLVPFERLLIATNALTLLVFATVNAALWRVKRRSSASEVRFPGGYFVVPRWLPPVAILVSLGLILVEFLA